LLLISLFALHLWTVGLATGAPFLCIALEWQETRHGDSAAGFVARRLGWHAVLALMIGGVLGLLIVGLFWRIALAAWFHGLSIIPAERLWFGLAELGFYLATMVLYLALWERWRNHRWLHRGLAVLGGTNLMYHFPLLFAVISVAASRRDLWGRTLSRTDLVALMSSPGVMAKAVHFWLASLVIAGVWSAVLAARDSAAANGRRSGILGGRAALAAALLQLPSGVYLLWTMAPSARDRLLGGDLLLSGALAAGLLASLALMYHLLAVALGDASRATLWKSVALLALTTLLMAGVQFETRKQLWRRSPRPEYRQKERVSSNEAVRARWAHTSIANPLRLSRARNEFA
jgi:hypothetical protein